MKSGMVRGQSLLRWGVLSFLLFFGLVLSVAGQAVSQTSFNESSRGPAGGLDLVPSNPLGMAGSTGGSPRGSDSVFLSSGMFRDILPLVPNLEIGYLYNFGNRVETSRLTLDYLLPVALSPDSALFGEAHSEWHNLWKTLKGFVLGAWANPDDPDSPYTRFDTRADISVGGGYRKFLNDNTLIGVNGFYDTSWVGGQWYSSGGVGCEMAMALHGNDAVDLTLNWYANLLSPTTFVNAFRNGPSNYDVEVGYSRELWGGGPDLRLKATGYQFSVGSTWTGETVLASRLAGPIYGWKFGTELKSRNGAFAVKYETGFDKANALYHTVGGFVSVGLQLERLLSGESPFVMPEPIFRSPRNLRRWLTRKVPRNWHQLASVVQTRAAGAVYFVVDVEVPVHGSFTGPPATGSAATWIANTVPISTVEGLDYYRYSIAFTGDVASLPPLVPVTVRYRSGPACTGGPDNGHFVWGCGISNNRSFTRNMPVPNGGTLGYQGTVLYCGNYRPVLWLRTNGATGLCGTVTFSAPGVTTLTISVVRP